MITTATCDTHQGTDPIAAALATLAAAGISAGTVSRCPEASCAVCGELELPRAA